MGNHEMCIEWGDASCRHAHDCTPKESPAMTDERLPPVEQRYEDFAEELYEAERKHQGRDYIRWHQLSDTTRQAWIRIAVLAFARFERDHPATPEVERLRTYAREVSVAFVALSGGGSEMFKRIGDDFYVDPEPCAARIREKMTQRERLALGAQTIRLCEALEWYADPKNWFGEATCDAGRRARAALGDE